MIEPDDKEEIKYLRVETNVVISEENVRKWLKDNRFNCSNKLSDRDYISYAENKFNMGHGCNASIIF